jgi:hypothetical protein
MSDDGERSQRSPVEELIDVIDVAARLADALGGDPMVQRVIEAFRLMPFEDREIIADVIEREVRARRLSIASEVATGQAMHPNPNARLYLRSHEKHTLARILLERDELMLAMLAGLRASPLLLVPEIHQSWIEGTRAALEHLEPSARRAASLLLREALALVEEADQSTAATDRPARAS